MSESIGFFYACGLRLIGCIIIKNRVEKGLNGKCVFSLCNLVVYGDYRKKRPKNTLRGVKFVTISLISTFLGDRNNTVLKECYTFAAG